MDAYKYVLCISECISKLVTVGYGDVVKMYSLDCQEKGEDNNDITNIISDHIIGVIKYLNDLRRSEPSLNW